MIFTAEFKAVKNCDAAGKSSRGATRNRMEQNGMMILFRKIARCGMIGRRNR